MSQDSSATLYGNDMAGSSSSDDEHRDGGRGAGVLVWVLVILLAVGATVVLVISADARLLRLAVVAALWAALIGAFVAARYRRAVSQRDESAQELRTVYELELEREVAARREYELEVENQTRQRLAEEARADVRDDLAALRSEIASLKQNLETLFGGELLVERVALRAESTRMRSIGEQPHRMLAAREGRQRGIVAGSIGKSLNGNSVNGDSVNGRSGANGTPAVVAGAGADPQTELIRAVAAKDWPERQTPQRPATRNEPARPERNRREPADQRPHGPTANGDRQPLGARRDAASRRDLPVPPATHPEDAAPTTYTRWEDSAPQPAVRADQPLLPPEPPAEPVYAAYQADPSARRMRPVEQSAPNGGPVAEHASRRGMPTVDPAYGAQTHGNHQYAEHPHAELQYAEPEPELTFDHASRRNLRPVEVQEPDDAGAHASGRSVSDLLAAHGNQDTPRRRRRRAED